MLVLRHMASHGLFDDVVLNFPRNDAGQLVCRERAHGQALCVEIKRILWGGDAMIIHQDLCGLNRRSAFSHGDGVVFHRHTGSRCPIAVIDVDKGHVPDFSIEQISDRSLGVLLEKWLTNNELQSLPNTDVIQSGGFILVRRPRECG